MMVIDLATEDDIPQLCGLLGQLFSQEAEFVADYQTQYRGLQQIISHPGLGAVLVAKSGQEIRAMVSLLYTVSTALGGRVALLEDMVTAPSHRSQGIGGRLLDAALAYASVQGCLRVTLLTDGNNLAARNFYLQHGFTVSPMLPLRRMLD